MRAVNRKTSNLANFLGSKFFLDQVMESLVHTLRPEKYSSFPVHGVPLYRFQSRMPGLTRWFPL